MAFEHKLNLMLRDLSDYKCDKSTIMQEAIIVRLDKALSSYKHDLDISSEYLQHRDSLKLINKINRSV